MVKEYKRNFWEAFWWSVVWLSGFSCLCLVSSASAAPSAAVRLVFKENVSVNDSVVRLGDIASIDCPDARLSSQLEAQVVGAASPAGYSRFLKTADALEFYVAPHFPSVDITVAEHKRITIETLAKKHKLADYEQQVLSYLRGHIQWKTGSWAAEVLNRNTTWQTLRKPCEVTVEGLKNGYPKGSIPLTLVVRQGTKTFHVGFRCRISVTLPVAVATRPISRGEGVTEDCYTFVEKDITGFGYHPIRSPEELANAIASRTISRGTVIHDRLVEERPAVLKGDLVYVHVGKGAIRVSVPVRARENGVIGDNIWAENVKSHKLLRVEVSGKGAATVANGGTL